MDLDGMDESMLDRLTSRTERLRMHQLVLSTLERERRDDLVRRWSGGDQPRIFSVGIGGLDLGMGQAVTRARGRSLQLGALSTGWSAGAAPLDAAAQAGPPPLRDDLVVVARVFNRSFISMRASALPYWFSTYC